MAEQVKKKWTDSVKETGRKVKGFVKDKGRKVKSYASSYKKDMQLAYNIGYAQGWEDSDKIPYRFGAQTWAMAGYKNGINTRRKSDKAQKKYNEIRGR